MHIGDAGYRNLKFFLTNRLELIKRTGKIFTARSCYHGKAFKRRVEHKLVEISNILTRFGTQIAPVVAVLRTLFTRMSPVVAVLRTLFTWMSPVVAVLPTVERASAGGPGAQPGGVRNQSPLCYASAERFLRFSPVCRL